MGALRLLGLDVEVNEQRGELSAPSAAHLKVHAWKGVIDAGKGIARVSAHLEIARRYTLSFDVTLHVENSEGQWQLHKGSHPHDPRTRFSLLDNLHTRPNDPALEIALGPIALASVTFPLNGLSGAFRVHPSKAALIAAKNLPVEIESAETVLTVDLSVPQVRFEAGSFRLTAAARRHMRRRRRSFIASFFRAEHDSREFVVPLDNAARGEQALVFDAVPDAMLALHVFPTGGDSEPTEEAPLVAPLGVTGHALRATLSGSSADGVRLARLTVMPGGTRLHAFSLADQLNQPQIYQPEDEFDLHVRAGTSQRLAMLLVAPSGATPGSTGATVGMALAGRAEDAVHGHVAATRFSPRGRGQLICQAEHAVAYDSEIPPGVLPDIVQEATVPWVFFERTSENQGFQHPRPGDAYVSTDAVDGRVETMRFERGNLPLPLLPPAAYQTALQPSQTSSLAEIFNRHLATNRYALRKTTHESGLLEKSPYQQDVQLHVQTLYRPADETTSLLQPDREPVQLQDYTVVRDYGRVAVQMKVHAGRVPDYVLLQPGDTDNRFLSGNSADEAPPEEPDFRWQLSPELDLKSGGAPQPESHDPGPGVRRRPLAILKLNQRLSLVDIFEREQLDRSVPGYERLDFVEHVLDATARSRLWVGLVLFNMPLDYEGEEILSAILPPGLPRLAYVALTPGKSTSSDAQSISLSARVLWRNDEPAPPLTAASPRDEEARFRVDELDIRWYDSALVHFRAAARVLFHRILGANRDEATLSIAGTYDREAGAIAFRGQLSEPLNLIPAAWGYGPFAELLVASADIRKVGGKTAVDLRGSLVWRSFGSLDRDWFRCPEGLATDFTTLTVDFPSKLRNDSSWIPLTINYPNLRLPADAVVFQLGFLNMTITELGVNWDKGLDWNRFLPLYESGGFRPADEFAYLRCRLELMKLPELASGSLDSLVLDFVFGFSPDASGHPGNGWDPARSRFVVKGVGIERMRLALLRFLVADAQSIAIETQSMTVAKQQVEVDWLVLEDISVSVLGQPLIEKFSLYAFSMPDGRRGMLGLLAPGSLDLPDDNEPEEPETDAERRRREEATDKGATPPRRKKKKRRARKAAGKAARGANGFLKMIEWALVGQNMRIERDLAQELVSLDADAGSVGEALGSAFANDELVPQVAADDTGDWIFAAGVDVEELFSGKFLFQEGAYYGLALSSPLFEKYFGLDLAVSVLYSVGDQPDEDAFLATVRVPEVVAPALTFLGGTVTLEVVLNGSFYLDVGFPHLNDEGIRDWDRAFGLIITPFIGSAGAYIRYRRMKLTSTALPAANLMVLSVGYAAQIGIAGSYGGGAFQVTASAGVYYALQGDLVLQNEEIRGLRVVGAVGLIVQASAELNWWIVSARLDLMLAAEARATLTWADPTLALPHGDTTDALVPLFTSLEKASDSTMLTLDMVVYASASAEACIGSGPFKLCMSFSVELPLRYSYDFKL